MSLISTESVYTSVLSCTNRVQSDIPCSWTFPVHPSHFLTFPLVSLIQASSVDHNLYADDTQLFISFSTNSFFGSILLYHRLLEVNKIASCIQMTSIIFLSNASI